MPIRFIIVKEYDAGGIKINDRKYYHYDFNCFIDDVNACAVFFSYEAAQDVLDNRVAEAGFFKIEKFFIKY